jgi:hypothetical protein
MADRQADLEILPVDKEGYVFAEVSSSIHRANKSVVLKIRILVESSVSGSRPSSQEKVWVRNGQTIA